MDKELFDVMRRSIDILSGRIERLEKEVFKTHSVSGRSKYNYERGEQDE